MLFEIFFCFYVFDSLNCVTEVFRGRVLRDDTQVCKYTLKNPLFMLLNRTLSLYHAAIEFLSCLTFQR